MSTKQENQVKKQTFKIKLLNFIKIFLIFFIIVHLFVYLSIFSRSARSGVHIKAKTFMSVATMLEFFYIIPMYKIWGWNAPLAKPFVYIRDEYYKLGNKHLPADDGEREMWWFIIKYAEYDKVVFPEIRNLKIKIYKYNKCIKYKNYDEAALYIVKPEDYKEHSKAVEEIYNKLEILAKKQIKDSKFAETRLAKFIGLARSYRGNKLYIYKLDKDVNRKLNDKEDLRDPILINKKEIQRINHIFSIYKGLLSKFEDQVKLISGVKHRQVDKVLFEKTYSEYLILNKINQNKFSCNDELIDYYGGAWDYIMDMVHNPNK